MARVTFNTDVNIAGRQFHSGDTVTGDSVTDVVLELIRLCHISLGTLGSFLSRLEETVQRLVSASHIVDVTRSYTLPLGLDQESNKYWVLVDCVTLDKVFVPSLKGLEEYNDKIVKVVSEDGNAICGLVISSNSYDVCDERSYRVDGVFPACAECLNSLEK